MDSDSLRAWFWKHQEPQSSVSRAHSDQSRMSVDAPGISTDSKPTRPSQSKRARKTTSPGNRSLKVTYVPPQKWNAGTHHPSAGCSTILKVILTEDPDAFMTDADPRHLICLPCQTTINIADLGPYGIETVWFMHKGSCGPGLMSEGSEGPTASRLRYQISKAKREARRRVLTRRKSTTHEGSIADLSDQFSTISFDSAGKA